MDGHPEVSTMAGEMPEQYSEEQREFAKEVRKFLAAYQSVDRVRELTGDPIGRDTELWRRAAKEVDLLGLMIPEEYGGSGFGFAEASLVLTAGGESLTSWPYLSSAVLATHCLVASRDCDAQARWLPALADGDVVATVALADDGGRWELGNESVRAEAGSDGTWTLTGHKSFVTDGPMADVLITFAATGADTRAFVVRTDAPGVESTALPALDATRKLSRFTFTGAPAEPLGSPEVIASHGDKPLHACGRGTRLRTGRRASPRRSSGPPSTPRTASSSGGASAASRRSSTGASTSTCARRRQPRSPSHSR